MIGQTLGHYRIVEKVGAGGMGEVFRARDQRLDRDVALKILPPSALADETARKRFRQEALALSRLNHPNIATIFDFDTQDATDFLVMEFVEGHTLKDLLSRGPMPERELLTLGAGIAEALEEAHEQGVVHCDLKPANIVVTRKHRVKILDFGLATLLRPKGDIEATQTVAESSSGAGTLPYLAPEQLRGERAGPRSDIYAAGAVLYEMATGRRAYPETEAPRLIDSVLHEPPVAPRMANPRVSAGLERIILKCLDKDPERRYQSAKELRVDLDRLATPEAAQRHHQPKGTTLWIGLGAAVLVIGALAAWWVRHRGAPATGPVSEVAVAVLPFQNLGSDHSTDFLRLALPDEISTTLSYVPTLAIRPSASTLKYAKADVEPQTAGRELQVADVVTGHYQQEGDRLRVTLEAIQVENNRVLWQESLSVAAKDLIELQDQVSARVRQGLVPILGAGLAPPESGSRPRNPEAFDLYLRSLAISSDPVPNKEAIAMLERSAGLDASYALAWNQLGDRYYFDGEYGDGGEAALARSKAAYQRALSLDPNLLEASAQLIARRVEDGELDAAVDEAESLVTRRPDSAAAHFALGYVLRYGGALDESARECDTALGLDRSSLFRSCAVTFELLKNYDRAREFLRLDAGSQWAQSAEVDILLREKKYEEAIGRLKQLPSAALFNPRLSEACLEHRPLREIEGMIRTDEAQTMATRDAEPKYFSASYYALCQQRDAALRMLRAAVEHNYCSYPAVDNDPLFDLVRDTREFAPIHADAAECNRKFLAHRAKRPQ